MSFVLSPTAFLEVMWAHYKASGAEQWMATSDMVIYSTTAIARNPSASPARDCVETSVDTQDLAETPHPGFHLEWRDDKPEEQSRCHSHATS